MSINRIISSTNHHIITSNNQHITIIGAGIGGLATAIRLSSLGWKVSVFEQNEYPGGKLSAFEMAGYQFDKGPSLFTQARLVDELFEVAKTEMKDSFSYKRLAVSCHYFYEDGTFVEAFTDKKALAKELETKLNVKADDTLKYFSDAEVLYENVGRIFLESSLHKAKTWWNKSILTALKTVKFSYLIDTLHKHNKQSLVSPKAVQLFDRFATYNGSNPYKAPAMLSVIPHFEVNEGVFYPKGGMISITNALYGLALEKGVEFHFNAPVSKIHCEDGKAKGIVSNGILHESDCVVSNLDAYFTYKNLLENEPKASKILKQERSSSALIFYWGVRKQFSKLQLHNIFFSNDYETEFGDIFNKKVLPKDNTVYINITSKMEEVHAPAGCENWFVMINTPENIGQDWEVIKQQAKKQILEKLERILGEPIASFIETEKIWDPISIESDTGSYRGSLYGTSSNSSMAAFMRHPNFSKEIENLFFVGGSVHPGGGIPLCLQSAKIVSELATATPSKTNSFFSSFKLSFTGIILLIFYTVGWVGMQINPSSMALLTPFNLLLTLGLLASNMDWSQHKNFYFASLCFGVGMVSEIIGVKTGYLFGEYWYSDILGYKTMGVPLLIGVNWFVTIYTIGIFMERYMARLPVWTKVILGSFTAVFFDFFLEKVAVNLHFWQWENDLIPFYNYLCWFAVSGVLLSFFYILKIKNNSFFPILLLAVQLFFFFTLSFLLEI